MTDSTGLSGTIMPRSYTLKPDSCPPAQPVQPIRPDRPRSSAAVNPDQPCIDVASSATRRYSPCHSPFVTRRCRACRWPVCRRGRGDPRAGRSHAPGSLPPEAAGWHPFTCASDICGFRTSATFAAHWWPISTPQEPEPCALRSPACMSPACGPIAGDSWAREQCSRQHSRWCPRRPPSPACPPS